MLLKRDFFINGAKNGTHKNPIKKPPAGDNKWLTPPLKPANTGAPTAPNNKYAKRENSDFLNPKSADIKQTANVCKVMGKTPNGKAIQEHTQMIAVATAIWHKSRAFNPYLPPLFVFFSSLLIPKKPSLFSSAISL